MRIGIIFFILFAGMFISCHNRQQGNAPVLIEAAKVIDTAGSCPAFTKDAKGNVVMSWIKNISDSQHLLCYSVSTDEGKMFSQPVEVTSSANIHPHAENLPKLLFKPSGEIIAAWGASNPSPKNAYTGLICYAQSFDNGKTWSAAKRLVSDTSSYDQRYFDVALLPGGEGAIVWLDNSNKQTMDGSDLYFAKTAGSRGFSQRQLIAQSCCECCRTAMLVDGNDIHILYRGIVKDSIRDIVHIVSADDGNHFSTPKRISNDNWVINGCPHSGPAITKNDKGLHCAWYSMGGGKGVFYCNSMDNGNNFSAKDTVSFGASAKHAQMATLSNNDIAVVWDQSVQAQDKIHNAIGLQQRSDDGARLITQFITGDSISAAFPVIKTLNNEQAIIAYTQSAGEHTKVCYQVVALQ